MDTYTQISGEYKKQFIEDIINGMSLTLDNNQLSELNKALYKHTNQLSFGINPTTQDVDWEKTNKLLMQEFEKSKKLEGLSPKSITAYLGALKRLNKWTIKSFTSLTSEDLKEYLIFYQQLNDCSNVSLDNVRRNISSFYKWLTDEEYIIVNPMMRIPAIKQDKKVKKAFTDSEIEKMRIYLTSNDYIFPRSRTQDIAIFELLLSSGIRVAELTNLKIKDLELNDCKGIVLGKGNKERIIYFSEKAKQSIQLYLQEREDYNPHLFVSIKGPYEKLGISGVERKIREIGRECGIHAHPHKFRRTMATKLIRKGMPIDQVQHLLGHTSLDVTLRYVETDEDLLQMVHQKYTNF